jgi:hypothetical protein
VTVRFDDFSREGYYESQMKRFPEMMKALGRSGRGNCDQDCLDGKRACNDRDCKRPTPAPAQIPSLDDQLADFLDSVLPDLAIIEALLGEPRFQSEIASIATARGRDIDKSLRSLMEIGLVQEIFLRDTKGPFWKYGVTRLGAETYRMLIERDAIMRTILRTGIAEAAASRQALDGPAARNDSSQLPKLNAPYRPSKGVLDEET